MTRATSQSLRRFTRTTARASALTLAALVASVPAESRSASHQMQRIAIRGGTMMVRNFLAAPDVVAVSPTKGGGTDESGDYYVLGSQPYEIVDTTPPKIAVPTALEKGYQIDFFPGQGTFSIFVYKQPIGAMRRAAANDLLVRLGISAPQLCEVLAIVWISPLADSSHAYAGRNVGLPNCPGASVLPGEG